MKSLAAFRRAGSLFLSEWVEVCGASSLLGSQHCALGTTPGTDLCLPPSSAAPCSSGVGEVPQNAITSVSLSVNGSVVILRVARIVLIFPKPLGQWLTHVR